MQWLIDIIEEKCKAYLNAYLADNPPSPCCHDRGDPLNVDFDVNDWIIDDDWHSRNVRSICPVGTKAILARVTIQSDNNTYLIQFRTKGNTHWPNVAIVRCVIANTVFTDDKIIALDSNREFEYKITAGSWQYINFTVGAYFVGEYGKGGFENRGDPSVPDFFTPDFTHDSNWRTLDLSSIIPVATKAVSLYVRLRVNQAGESIRFRTLGNSNIANRSEVTGVVSVVSHYYDVIVPVEGQQSIEYWSNLGLAPILEVTVKCWWK